MIFFVVAAVYVLFYTGCRPEEAAYIVQHRTIAASQYTEFLEDIEFVATTPAAYNKTPKDYLWLLPREMDRFVKEVWAELPKSPFKDPTTSARRSTTGLAGSWTSPACSA